MNWTLLLTLVCPLMMLPMMFGKKGHNHGSHNNQTQMDQGIQKELQELKMQNEQMRKDIQNLS